MAVEDRLLQRAQSALVPKLRAAQASELLRAMAASGSYKSNPVERIFRDIHQARGHYANNTDAYARAHGAVMLGLPNNDPFVEKSMNKQEFDVVGVGSVARARPTAIPLRTQISLLVCGVVLVALAATGLAVTAQVEGRTREALVEKAAMAATLTAEARSVVEGLEGRAPAGDIQPYVARLVELTAVDYIVVLDMKGARLSHPNPGLLGARFVGGDDAPVYEGKAYTSLAKGTLGTAHRVFRPVRNAQGRQVGAVAAGVLVSGMGQTTRAVRRLILLGALLGFGIGAGGALLVAGRVKRIMLGMEPGDMAALLQQRNAVLQSVRAGIVATDAEQRITPVHQEATRPLRLVGQEGDPPGGEGTRATGGPCWSRPTRCPSPGGPESWPQVRSSGSPW